MREFKGHQLRQTWEQFDRLLREAGIEADTLDVISDGAGRHLIILGGSILGQYRYESGRFIAQNGYTYSWRDERLYSPEGSSQNVPFEEALKIIIDRS